MGDEGQVFDVFLCHHGVDKPAVKQIGKQLRQKGLLPWLDEWELPPGLPWQPELEKQIKNIKSAAVFVGANGMGPWQQQESNAFLREFVKRRCPVIPVLLEDAPLEPELPIFLQGMTWVDFRKEDPDPLESLMWGIGRGKPEPLPATQIKPKQIGINSVIPMLGNKGTIIFDLNGVQHTLEYMRDDRIAYQIFSLKERQKELVRLQIPFATFRPIEKREKFQIDGVEGVFIFKMSAVTSIMSVKVEVGGVEVFRT